MKNKIIIAAVVGLLIVVSAVVLLKDKDNEPDEAQETPTASVEAQATKSVSNSSFTTLQEAYKSNKSLRCTLDASFQKFTFYFKDGNMRYESSITSGSMKVETGQIIKKDVAYTWTNMSSDIITTTDPKTIEFSRNTIFQLDTLISQPRGNTNLVCVETNVSNSLFDKPKN